MNCIIISALMFSTRLLFDQLMATITYYTYKLFVVIYMWG